MKFKLTATVIVVLLAGGACWLLSAGTRPPDWHPREQAQGILVVPVNSDATAPRFTMKMLSDMEPHTSIRNNQKFFLFRGRSRADGTAPAFVVSTVRKTHSQAKPLTMEEGLKVMLDAIQVARKQQWRQTAPEAGRVNGQPFLRAYFSGVEPVTKKMMHGFAYATVVGDDLITMSGQDFDPMSQKTTGDLEDAALTFQIR